MRHMTSLALTLFAIAATGPALAQQVPAQVKTPNAKALSAAYKMTEDLFAQMKDGKTEEIAKMLVDSIGHAWDAQTRVKNMNDFKAKLDMIAISPPAGSYGKLSGYDLIEESSLPGTDRYFRLTYITYHEASPMIWEFRFYVKPDGTVSLNYCGWSDKNPFEYLSSSDMQMSRWYQRP